MKEINKKNNAISNVSNNYSAILHAHQNSNGNGSTSFKAHTIVPKIEQVSTLDRINQKEIKNFVFQ